jgi:hypothetical protein
MRASDTLGLPSFLGLGIHNGIYRHNRSLQAEGQK